VAYRKREVLTVVGFANLWPSLGGQRSEDRRSRGKEIGESTLTEDDKMKQLEECFMIVALVLDAACVDSGRRDDIPKASTRSVGLAHGRRLAVSIDSWREYVSS
jgi:hypothetical protein